MSNVECRIGRLVGCGPAKRESWIGFLVAALAIVGAIDDVRAQPSSGACCLPNGTCTVTNDPFVCSNQNGIFRGNATCAGVICTGACCLPNGICTSGSSQSCTSAAGEFKGFGSLCANQVCGGACCLADKSCTETGLGNCTSLNGLFQGLGTLCEHDCPSRLTTAFKYQGQLKRDGVPLNGLIDGRFSLWLIPMGEDPADQIGSTQVFNSVEVVNGLFDVLLDFGQNAFNGNARWLQVEIHDHDDLPGTFTTLSPRQALTPTPYALQTRGIVVHENGNVGIGTKTPTSKVEIAAQDGLALTGFQPFVTLRDTNNANLRSIIQGANGKIIFYPASFIGGTAAMVINNGTGNVGIGTAAPLAKLDVRGDIRLGSTGQYRAAGSEEALRIVRGIVWFDGGIITGSGFQVTHPSTGYYTITFNTPFAGTPTMTVTVDVNDNVPAFAMIEGSSAGSVNVRVFLSQGESNANRAFHFIAVGPR